MFFVENGTGLEAWSERTTKRAQTHDDQRRGAGLAVLAFALVLILAQVSWLSLLAYVTIQSIL